MGEGGAQPVRAGRVRGWIGYKPACWTARFDEWFALPRPYWPKPRYSKSEELAILWLQANWSALGQFRCRHVARHPLPRQENAIGRQNQEYMAQPGADAETSTRLDADPAKLTTAAARHRSYFCAAIGLWYSASEPLTLPAFGRAPPSPASGRGDLERHYAEIRFRRRLDVRHRLPYNPELL